MPAIAREMTRRTALLLFCAAPSVAADSAADAWEVITTLAGALGRGDAGEFLSMCDSTTPAYAALRVNVPALLAQAEVESGIDPVENSGDDRARQVVVDWQLQLVARTALERITRRRETVKCSMEKRGRKWKIVGIEPLGFFGPMSA
jgi:hypothetical protein